MHSLSADQIVKIYTQPELAKQLDISQWMLLVLVLRNQQLLACYSARFKQADMFEQIPSKPQRHFKNADALADNHKQQVLFEAKELKSMLGNGYEYLLFLKGAGYTLSKDKVGETRVYNDIDVLADKSSIENIERRLCMLGWMSEELTDHDEKYYRKWAHEIPPLRHGKRGTIIDVHHNIVPIISGRQIDADQFSKHSLTTEDGFQVLSYAAMTMHSLVHLFFNEDVKKGYRDLIDLHVLMTHHGDEGFWSSLVAIGQETGFEKELYLACRYTYKLLGTKIPQEVTRQIRGYKPWNIAYLDFMYMRALKPSHPLCRERFFGLAEFLILIRGHYQKMPLHILVFHLATKSCIGLIQSLLGKHFFTKELDKP